MPEIAKQNEIEFLKHVYERFNTRDMEIVLAAMHEDVTWANGMEGGHVHGREEVRSYWTRQWAMVNPHVEPVGFSNGPEGEVIVEVHQVVHDLQWHPFDGSNGGPYLQDRRRLDPPL